MRSDVDLRNKLAEQISFLQSSCILYDNGNTNEAIRISTALRVIFHQTSESTSILTHLNETSIKLKSSVVVPVPANVNTFDGQLVTNSISQWQAALDAATFKDLLFAEWWNEVIGIEWITYLKKETCH